MEPVKSSGVLSTTATEIVVRDSAALLNSVILNPGTAASVVNIYDPLAQGVVTTVGATLILKVNAVANGDTVSVNLDRDIFCKNGILVEITGAAATATILYAKI